MEAEVLGRNDHTGGLYRTRRDMGMQQRLSKPEQRRVEKHRDSLSSERGSEVSYEEALQDWNQHHGQRWRKENHARMLAREREEILRHKWIESEKAQRDLGAEAALDWIRKYAAQWRKWYDEEHMRNEV